MLDEFHTNGSSPPTRRDYLGRPLRGGDVVVYAVLTGRNGGGQPLRRGVITSAPRSPRPSVRGRRHRWWPGPTQISAQGTAQESLLR